MNAPEMPSDRAILEEIYNRYYQTHLKWSQEERGRIARNYIPIDIAEIARPFGVDPNLIFGQIYYHLDHKYRYKRDDGTSVSLFELGLGGGPVGAPTERHCINFPYLASILADLNTSHWKAIVPIVISCVSLAVSLVTLWLRVKD